jgi:O-antigen/teichoic acid export membrane protein
MLSGGVWIFFGKGLTVLCTMLSQALLARILDQDEYGSYILAFSIVSVFSIAAQMGLHQTAVRFVAESIGLGRLARARESLGIVYRWALVGGAGTILLLVAGPGAWVINKVRHAPELAAVIGTLAIWAVLISFQVITSESFRGFKDLRFAALFGGAVTGILNVILLSLIFVGWGSTDLATVFRVVVVAASISLMIGLLTLYRGKVIKLPVDRSSIARSEIFAVAMPLWAIVMINNLLAHSDRWILAAFVSKEDLAVYGAAAQMVMLVSQPLILINLLVPPFIAELYAKGEHARLERILRSTAALAGVPALLVLGVFMLFGSSILGVMFGAEYRAGASILAILSVAKVVNVLTGSAGITMAMTGHQNVMMRIALSVSSVSMIATFLVAKPYGPTGVALVVSAGSTMVFLLQWWATHRFTGMWTHPKIPTLHEIKGLLKPGAATRPPDDES